MIDDDDMAFDALLKAAAELEPEISIELLRKSFAIQRQHQFDPEEAREISMLELKSLLNKMIDETEPT